MSCCDKIISLVTGPAGPQGIPGINGSSPTIPPPSFLMTTSTSTGEVLIEEESPVGGMTVQVVNSGDYIVNPNGEVFITSGGVYSISYSLFAVRGGQNTTQLTLILRRGLDEDISSVGQNVGTLETFTLTNTVLVNASFGNILYLVVGVGSTSILIIPEGGPVLTIVKIT